MTISYNEAATMLMQACAEYLYHHEGQSQRFANNWRGEAYAGLNNNIKKISEITNILPFDPKEVHGEQPENELFMLTAFLQHVGKGLLTEEALTAIQQKLAYNAEDYSRANDENCPVSTKWYLALKHLEVLARILHAISRHPEYKGAEIKVFTDEICRGVNKLYPVIMGDIKAKAVKELQENLQSFDDERNVKAFEAQLRKGRTAAILQENRQSTGEFMLKLLSVISILIGVGIFTTLGLMVKRAIQTRGYSCNFFRPLTEQLHMKMQDVIGQCELPAAMNS
ncbi:MULTISPECIES: hypothetical protein [Legionella]|uniref:Uncharacterized protein n=1 Tax=Legionella septentrionalis TaxID=2498109 RepID=A0A3S0X5Z7_9GAMM|nr:MULTISPECIES: hypothetical protein [Legionella]MCP0913109.1 hypothetical protein [Legionella sp. 27cVA30]RUQ91559.1 hypothetical protein EKM59_00420 [Legionella septentrionalis]RUQ94696.1 hypothetical protein ELY11_10540 [Legionella septentrionalis]RUR10609.1 hypothetical protein ELY14_04650 [Legionella septentrionalis]RUR17162.1 hypothetical protein ELY10_02100 [Legionella septentrionalis]